jgi:hypothetical protein
MATTSTDLVVGTAPPPFSLPDVVSGRVVSLEQVRAGRALLVMLLCRHCPYVKHVEAELAGISANDAATYPEDAPAGLKEQAAQAGFTFPYLYDESQNVARAYGAVCTPEFFLFDAKPLLAYHGRLDASRPGREPATGSDLRAALDAVLAGSTVEGPHAPSVGCSIKWKRS